VAYRALAWLAALSLAALPARAQAPPARDTLRMVFVGDLNFARSLASTYLLRGRGAEVLAGVSERLRRADIAVGNLESILLERGDHADTTNSPVFAGPQREAIPLLLEAGFDVLGTANNHAWDFARAGLLESLAHLDTAGLAHTGTGPTLEAAWRPVVLRAKGSTVAVFSITAIFNYPDLTVRGHPAECCVAWLDTTLAAARFRAARDSLGADLVIAFVHAGMEYRPVPEPHVVMSFRALARAGADAVIGHHPHVPQGVEWVGATPIVYSLGNFVFRQRSAWADRGLWAELLALPDGARRLVLLPLQVGYTPRFASGADSARVMAHVDSISARIPRAPRLPNAASRRNVARPSTPTRYRPHG
jgi:poly-gamma-glutamate synthesis protein (capsule biosynthesis protein)